MLDIRFWIFLRDKNPKYLVGSAYSSLSSFAVVTKEAALKVKSFLPSLDASTKYEDVCSYIFELIFSDTQHSHSLMSFQAIFTAFVKRGA